LSSTDDPVVSFAQSGGIAGLRKGCEVRFSALDKAAQSAVEGALKKGARPPKSGRAPVARDLVQYRFVFRKGRQKRQFLYDELTLPDPLRPLVDALVKQAKPLSL
jgi:hypothetical protein